MGDQLLPLLPTPRATRGGSATETARLIPTPTVQDSKNTGSGSQIERNTPPLNAAVTMVDWGKYEPAIRRHEEAFGRRSPGPTDGEGRLSPAFVEWMMTYPEGWLGGISRTGQLRALGNAIVPPQAAAAWGSLLGLDATVTEREREREQLLPTPRTSDTNGPGQHGNGGPDLRTVVRCL